jgi:transcriptional regulator with XRE-family HTH domain
MSYGHAHNLLSAHKGPPSQLDVFDPAVRDDMTLRNTLASRNIPQVYRLLCKMGYSQRQISRLAKQTQSEVSEIIKGRQVLSYDLLIRIADGLGVPRGWMGLAYDATAVVELEHTDSTTGPIAETEDVKRRNYLITATSIFFGGRAVFGLAKPIVEPTKYQTQPPRIVKRSDVKALRALTAEMRALGRAGNGGMPNVLTPIAVDKERFLRIDADSDKTAIALRSALAEMHTLAGWCAHDMNLVDTARWHYSRATTLAGEADDIAEVVSATWHAAIMERDHDPDFALKLLQLAQARGSEIITPTMNAALHVSSARACSLMGRHDDVHRYLSRARDLPPPENAFDRAGLDNVRAQCYLALGNLDAAHHYAEESVNTWNSDDRREATKARITLATVHAVAGEPIAARSATAALDGAEALYSLRVRAQLEPLEVALATRYTSTHTDLAHRAHSIRCAA